MSRLPSLFDVRDWPAKLVANAITPGDKKRLFGYSIEEGLARSCNLSVLLYLSLATEVPTPQQLRWFEVGMWFASAISIETAPSHAATLTRMCGSTPTAIQAVAATSLAELAHVEFVAHEAQLRSFAAGEDLAPTPDHDADVIARIVAALGEHAAPSRAARQSVGRTCAVLLLLAESGLTSSEQLERALVLARFPTVNAEAFAARSGRFMDDYPVHLPPVEYVEE